MESTPPKRRRLRVTLRVAMLLVLVAGVWMASVVNSARRQREAVADIKSRGGVIHYDWEYVGGKLTKGARPRGPAWIRRYLGDEFFQDVVSVTLQKTRRASRANRDASQLSRLKCFPRMRSLLIRSAIPVGDAELRQIAAFASLESLSITGTMNLTDEGVAYLKPRTNLKRLTLTPAGNGRLTDASLRHLSGLSRLESLSLTRNKFTDEGLAHLGRMSRLKLLGLGQANNGFSDKAMPAVAALKDLERLDLGFTHVTPEGLEHLRTLPKLKWLEVGYGLTRETRRAMQAMFPQATRVQ